MMSEKELLALADDIEESDGLAMMKPIGPIQLGIKKTSTVIAAIRAAASLRALAELPPKHDTHRGRSDTLNGAKAAFRKAWDEIKADLSYDQIREAREIQNQKRSWDRE